MHERCLCAGCTCARFPPASGGASHTRGRRRWRRAVENSPQQASITRVSSRARSLVRGSEPRHLPRNLLKGCQQGGLADLLLGGWRSAREHQADREPGQEPRRHHEGRQGVQERPVIAPGRSCEHRLRVRSLRGGGEAEKQLESLVDAGELARRHLSEDAADAALVDRPEMIDEGAGWLRESTRSR